MPCFQIIPTEASCPETTLNASNPADVLILVQRLAGKAADVLRDGHYCFSVRLGNNGLWSIYQRQPVLDDHVVPLAG